MVVIHAWRSADAIERFKSKCPAAPVVLQLSGTDIYQYITNQSVTWATLAWLCAM